MRWWGDSNSNRTKNIIGTHAIACPYAPVFRQITNINHYPTFKLHSPNKVVVLTVHWDYVDSTQLKY